MSGLWTSLSLLSPCARASAPGMLADGLDGMTWWFSLSLGVLWTWVCLVVVGSVSGVMITWAVRMIRKRRAAATFQPNALQPNAYSLTPPSPAATGAMIDTNHLVLQALWHRVAWKDADGKYLGCTQAAAEAMGLANPSQILGKTQRDFLSSDQSKQAEMLEKCDTRVRQTGQSVTCMLVRCLSDGRTACEEIFKIPVKDPTGKVIGIVETADSKEDAVCNPSYAVTLNAEKPSTAENQSLGERWFTREYCKMVIEDMVEGFALHEVIRGQDGRPTDYRILDVNPMYEEFIGLRRNELIGKCLSELSATGLPALTKKFTLAIEGNKPCQFRWRCQTTNRDLQFVSYGMRSEDHVAALVLDMTDQVRAEEESRQLQEQLHHTRKMEAIGQLAGGIAHDFNNLLTAIHGNAELIRLDSSSTPSLLESADQIIKASQRMGDLTQQLLAFGRKGKLQSIPVDMHEAIIETVKLLAHSIDRRIEITQELRASYPIVMGDPSQLKNALLNLAINARDAMPGGGKLVFSTRVTRLDPHHDPCCKEGLQPGQYLEIAVRDTGVGMDDATLERIFEPFFTTKKIGEGTGLGLAGVYGCMKNHKGFVDVESKPNQGSTFRLFIPTVDSPVGVYASDGPKPKHLLVIDDEDMVRNYAVRALRTLGYRASFCADGEEAVRYYRDNHHDIDLVLLDLIMPRMGGLETFRELKHINPNIRALLISGYTDHNVVEQLRSEGVLGFVNKPFEIEALAKELASYLDEDVHMPRTRN